MDSRSRIKQVLIFILIGVFFVVLFKTYLIVKQQNEEYESKETSLSLARSNLQQEKYEFAYYYAAEIPSYRDADEIKDQAEKGIYEEGVRLFAAQEFSAVISLLEYIKDESKEASDLYKKASLAYEEELEESKKNAAEDAEERATKRALEQEIYDFMMEQFDILTNNGKKYIPEKHDPIVIDRASRHFGITKEEADMIFLNAAMDQ